MRNGGAPDPSFDIDKDLAALEDQFRPSTNITLYYSSKTVDQRDRIVTGRLVLMDIRYIQFIRSLTVDKQQLDAATDILSISLNLAGAATSAVRAKTNLAMLAAGVTGAKTSIDKHFYFEKTVPALVTSMNASRKGVMTRILDGLTGDLTQYPFERAISDLNDYYMAGTLNSAISSIQADASDREKVNDAELKKRLVPLSKPNIEKRGDLADVVAALTDFDKAKAVLARLEGTLATPPATLAEAKDRLIDKVRNARSPPAIVEMEKLFKDAKIL
jgi:hypothetical protein